MKTPRRMRPRSRRLLSGNAISRLRIPTRGIDGTAQRRAERNHASVELASAVFVLLNLRAAQFQAGKRTPCAGIAEHLGLQLPVRIRCSMAADRARGHTGVGTEFELAGEQILHAIVVHDQHDEIYRLPTNLQPKAATFDREECRGTPTLGRTATGHTAAVTGAQNESTLQHGGHYGNAL